jgi:hypothetical protein
VRALLVAGAVLTFLSGCPKQGGGGAEGGAGSGAGTSTGATTIDESACTADALKLVGARPAPIWKAPEGCTLRPAGAGGLPIIVRTEEELQAHLECKGKVASGVAFERESVVLAVRTLSPAGTGTNVFDDGKIVTLVSKQRSPCKNEAPPMPVSYTMAFTIAASPVGRTFTESTCKVSAPCP